MIPSEDIGAVLGALTLISFLLALACMADGPESFENKPTTWLLSLFCIPGGLVILALATGVTIIISPFLFIDWAWEKRTSNR